MEVLLLASKRFPIELMIFNYLVLTVVQVFLTELLKYFHSCGTWAVSRIELHITSWLMLMGELAFMRVRCFISMHFIK